MPIGTELRKIANEIADRMQQRGAQLQHEIENLETVLARKKAELDTTDRVHDRLADFAIQVGSDYQCPACWIERETRSSLTPLGGGTRSEESFRCRACGRRFNIPSPANG
jgi:hypothetical protein